MKPKHRIDPFIGKYALPNLVSCMWNYWHPIASKIMDGIDYRITQGFVDWVAKKQSCLLYKDGHIVGVFDSVDEAKEFINKNHQEFIDMNILQIYSLNKYNQN